MQLSWWYPYRAPDGPTNPDLAHPTLSAQVISNLFGTALDGSPMDAGVRSPARNTAAVKGLWLLGSDTRQLVHNDAPCGDEPALPGSSRSQRKVQQRPVTTIDLC